MAVEVLTLLKKLAVKLHLDLLHLGGDHVSRHVCQVLLDFDDFGLAQPGFTRLVIHFEKLNFFKFVLSLPSDRLGLLLRLIW